jgi:hypothetical protein
MATQPTHPASIVQPAHPTTEPRQSLLGRRRARHAERKLARLTSARNRRHLARWIRRITKLSSDRDPIRRRHDVLLRQRATAARFDLLEIAAILERAHDPDPDCITALHDLLAHTRPSPLYDPKIPFTELEVTLDYVRSGL